MEVSGQLHDPAALPPVKEPLVTITSWCRIIFEKLIKKYPAFFMELEGSSPSSQKPATGPYTEPAESSSPHGYLPLKGQA
jgi:hypothetical protein